MFREGFRWISKEVSRGVSRGILVEFSRLFKPIPSVRNTHHKHISSLPFFFVGAIIARLFPFRGNSFRQTALIQPCFFSPQTREFSQSRILSKGVLTPAEKAWAEGQPLEALSGLIAARDPLAVLTRQSDGKPGQAALSAAQREICAGMGIDQKDYQTELAKS